MKQLIHVGRFQFQFTTIRLQQWSYDLSIRFTSQHKQTVHFECTGIEGVRGMEWNTNLTVKNIKIITMEDFVKFTIDCFSLKPSTNIT